MKSLFVSYNYTADDHGRIISGFENDILDLQDTPEDYTFFEHLNEVIQTRAREQLGVRAISIVILFFKEIEN